MISISLDQLRDFQKRVTGIKPDTTLPALQNIKLHQEDGSTYLTRNSQRAVCVAKIVAVGEAPTLLLNTEILFHAINIAKTDTITISWDEGRIYISDGKTPMYHSRQNPVDFPVTPVYQNVSGVFKLGKGHLDCLSIAKNFILNTETGGNYRFVHITSEFITAVHTNFFYANNRFLNMPDMFLDGDTVDALVSAADVAEYNFGATDRHYFFQTSNVVYIFTQQEGCRKIDTRKSLWEKFLLDGKEFSIAKQDLLDFCASANVSIKSELARCSMTQEGGLLHLTAADNSRNQGANKSVSIIGALDKFNFDSKLYFAPFKAIPYENLKCKMRENNLLISSPDGKEWFVFTGMA